MVVDNRMVGKRADGKKFDTSGSETFDYSRFYADLQASEKLQVSKQEMTWIRHYRRPESPVDVVLNLSCGVQTIPHIMLVQVALFEKLGINFVATAGSQFCCGRVYQRFEDKAPIGDRMAATSIKRFASWGATDNIQCCGSCFTEFEYQVAKRSEETGEALFDVIHITEYLRDKIKSLGDAVPWRRPIPCRVLLHAEGAELHPSKAAQRAAVIETLEMIPGVEYVGLAENPSLGNPCATESPGAPSILNDITPEQYRQVQAELEAQADEAGADMILTHHHFCTREWSKFSSRRLPIMSYQLVLAEALGVQIVDRFRTLWQLGDPDKILEKSRPQWESWGLSETEARELVQKFFVPKYASAIQRCPCEGTCFAAPAGFDGDAGVCASGQHLASR
jgi:hypothetical protein